jgi:SAM-dependent methyltransferase
MSGPWVLPALHEAGFAIGDAGFVLGGASVLDVGCGHGGVLAELAAAAEGHGGLAPSVGIDLDGEMIRHARGRFPSPRVAFERADFFGYGGGDRGFDLVLLRDVLEHIVEPERALEKALSLLRPGGLLYLSYAPFYSPFGGHQHNGAGVFSHVPWLQMLPAGIFRGLLRLSGNAYKTGEHLAADMDTVLRTRLTLRRFGRMLRRLPFAVLSRRRYLVRPDYRIKFGLPPLACPTLPEPLQELLCTGEEAVLRRGGA